MRKFLQIGIGYLPDYKIATRPVRLMRAGSLTSPPADLRTRLDGTAPRHGQASTWINPFDSNEFGYGAGPPPASGRPDLVVDPWGSTLGPSRADASGIPRRVIPGHLRCDPCSEIVV